MFRKQIVQDEKIPPDANFRDAKVPWPFEVLVIGVKVTYRRHSTLNMGTIFQSVSGVTNTLLFNSYRQHAANRWWSTMRSILRSARGKVYTYHRPVKHPCNITNSIAVATCCLSFINQNHFGPHSAHSCIFAYSKTSFHLCYVAFYRSGKTHDRSFFGEE